MDFRFRRSDVEARSPRERQILKMSAGKLVSKLQIHDFLVSSQPKVLPGNADYPSKVRAAIIDRGLIDESRLRDCDNETLNRLSLTYSDKAVRIWKNHANYDEKRFRHRGLKKNGFLTQMLDLSELPPLPIPAKAKNRRPGGGRKSKTFSEKRIRAKQNAVKAIKDMAGNDPGPIIMAANAVASKVQPPKFGQDLGYVLHKLTGNPTLTKKVQKFIEKGGNFICNHH